MTRPPSPPDRRSLFILVCPRCDDRYAVDRYAYVSLRVLPVCPECKVQYVELVQEQPRAGDLRAEPITGWRLWRYAYGVGLGPIAMNDYVWRPGVNVATCHNIKTGMLVSNDPVLHVPGVNCGCGFWILKDQYDMAQARVDYANVGGHQLVWGQCEGWGRYVEHQRGFRVQYAQPTVLHAQSAEVAEALEDWQRDEEFKAKVELKTIPSETRAAMIARARAPASLSISYVGSRPVPPSGVPVIAPTTGYVNLNLLPFSVTQVPEPDPPTRVDKLIVVFLAIILVLDYWAGVINITHGDYLILPVNIAGVLALAYQVIRLAPRAEGR